MKAGAAALSTAALATGGASGSAALSGRAGVPPGTLGLDDYVQHIFALKQQLKERDGVVKRLRAQIRRRDESLMRAEFRVQEAEAEVAALRDASRRGGLVKQRYGKSPAGLKRASGAVSRAMGLESANRRLLRQVQHLQQALLQARAEVEDTRSDRFSTSLVEQQLTIQVYVGEIRRLRAIVGEFADRTGASRGHGGLSRARLPLQRETAPSGIELVPENDPRKSHVRVQPISTTRLSVSSDALGGTAFRGEVPPPAEQSPSRRTHVGSADTVGHDGGRTRAVLGFGHGHGRGIGYRRPRSLARPHSAPRLLGRRGVETLNPLGSQGMSLSLASLQGRSQPESAQLLSVDEHGSPLGPPSPAGSGVSPTRSAARRADGRNHSRRRRRQHRTKKVSGRFDSPSELGVSDHPTSSWSSSSCSSGTSESDGGDRDRREQHARQHRVAKEELHGRGQHGRRVSRAHKKSSHRHNVARAGSASPPQRQSSSERDQGRTTTSTDAHNDVSDRLLEHQGRMYGMVESLSKQQEDLQLRMSKLIEDLASRRAGEPRWSAESDPATPATHYSSIQDVLQSDGRSKPPTRPDDARMVRSPESPVGIQAGEPSPDDIAGTIGAATHSSTRSVAQLDSGEHQGASRTARVSSDRILTTVPRLELDTPTTELQDRGATDGLTRDSPRLLIHRKADRPQTRAKSVQVKQRRSRRIVKSRSADARERGMDRRSAPALGGSRSSSRLTGRRLPAGFATGIREVMERHNAAGDRASSTSTTSVRAVPIDHTKEGARGRMRASSYESKRRRRLAHLRRQVDGENRRLKDVQAAQDAAARDSFRRKAALQERKARRRAFQDKQTAASSVDSVGARSGDEHGSSANSDTATEATDASQRKPVVSPTRQDASSDRTASESVPLREEREKLGAARVGPVRAESTRRILDAPALRFPSARLGISIGQTTKTDSLAEVAEDSTTHGPSETDQQGNETTDDQETRLPSQRSAVEERRPKPPDEEGGVDPGSPRSHLASARSKASARTTASSTYSDADDASEDAVLRQLAAANTAGSETSLSMSAALVRTSERTAAVAASDGEAALKRRNAAVKVRAERRARLAQLEDSGRDAKDTSTLVADTGVGQSVGHHDGLSSPPHGGAPKQRTEVPAEVEMSHGELLGLHETPRQKRSKRRKRLSSTSTRSRGTISSDGLYDTDSDENFDLERDLQRLPSFSIYLSAQKKAAHEGEEPR